MNERLDRPLSEREVEELDELLAGLPKPYDPLDVVALDGFLMGVLLQPEPVPEAEWLPFVWHGDGAVVPDNEVSARIEAFVRRRHAELAACLAAGEEFDPILFDVADDDGEPLTGRDAIAALEPWVTGFMVALQAFPALDDRAEDDEDLAEALTLIFRHLPLAEDATDDERATHEREQRALDDEVPVASLDEALDLVIGSALRIDEIVHPRRPVVRDTPKVGRNDPCPCGSGRKYKVCHGRGE
ncbi:MAG: UPF0149 family protein [Burkholderiales bacterium]